MDNEKRNLPLPKKGVRSQRMGKYSVKKDRTWGRTTSDKNDKMGKRRTSVDYSNNKQPRITTKKRFQWRYRNRMCFEQEVVKHEDGKEIPVSRQFVYVTDSSEGEDCNSITANMKQISCQGDTININGDLTDRQNIKERKSSSEEIEWDYSDITDAAQKIVEDEKQLFKNTSNTNCQVLPNFVNFDQVDLETDIFVRKPKMGTRSLKDSKQKLKFFTSFGCKQDQHESLLSPSGFKEQNKSDSGIHDVFSYANNKDSSDERSQNQSKESDYVGQSSFEVLSGLQLFSHDKKEDCSNGLNIDDVIPDCYVSCKDNLDSRRNSRSDNIETSEENLKTPKTIRKSRSEERSSPVALEMEDKDDHSNFSETFWKNRSKSLDASDSSTEVTPRSRHSWCSEHLHVGYHIQCSLCKSRAKRESKRHAHLSKIHHINAFDDGETDLTTTGKVAEEQFSIPAVGKKDQEKDLRCNQMKHIPVAQLKFKDLVQKFEQADQFPKKINISRSASFDGSLNKETGKRKEFIPEVFRKNVQLISKEFVQKSQNASNPHPFTRIKDDKKGPSSAKYVRSLRIRSHSFTSGTNENSPVRNSEIKSNALPKTSAKQMCNKNNECDSGNYKTERSLKLQIANKNTASSKVQTENDSHVTWLKLSDGAKQKMESEVNNDKTSAICNGSEVNHAGRNIAILDFSETEPTVRYNLQDGKEPKCGHIYHVVNSSEEAQKSSAKATKEISETNRENKALASSSPKVIAKVDFVQDSSDSFESEGGCSSVLSITDTTLEDNVYPSEESIIKAAIPVHLFRSSCTIDRQLIGMSNVEFWYNQLLGVHRLILIARLCDHFRIRRWRSRRKRHVTVFYRDNFLVVCEKNDQSKDECSFDVSWSPEFMSTPRDTYSHETITQPSMEPDSLELDDLDLEKPETVKEALERIMYGKMKVKITTDEQLQSENKNKQGDWDNLKRPNTDGYSNFQRTTSSHQSKCRKFDDLELSTASDETHESIINETVYTSVWDSHVDSGYDVQFNNSHQGDYFENISGTISDATLLDSTVSSSLSEGDVTAHTNEIIAEVVEQSISPIECERKRKYATTIVIFTTEASDSESIASGISEESDQSHTQPNKSYHSTKTVNSRFVSAFSISDPNGTSGKGNKIGVVCKQETLQPKIDEIGLHRFVCLDMPLNVWPVQNHIGYTLPVEHIESDNSATFNESYHSNTPIHTETSKCFTNWAERSKLHKVSLHIDNSTNKDNESDQSHDSIISTDGTMTEVTQNTSFTTPADGFGKSSEDLINTSNESAIGISDTETMSSGKVESNANICTDTWDAYRKVTANNVTLDTQVLDFVENRVGLKKVEEKENKRHTTELNGIVLAPCSLPVHQTNIDDLIDTKDKNDAGDDFDEDNFSGDEQVLVLQRPRNIFTSLHNSPNSTFSDSASEPASFSSDINKPIGEERTPKLENYTKPPLPKGKTPDRSWSYNIQCALSEPDLPDSNVHAFAGQKWEAEQWETHFGSCNEGPRISLPGEQIASQGSLNSFASRSTATLDLVNCPVSHIVSHILNDDQDMPFIRFTEYNSTNRHKNAFDTSLNDTFNETVEEMPFKLNKSFSQVENSTRILRIMDFAADGVDLMSLLNKTSKSSSCPNLYFNNFNQKVVANSKEMTISPEDAELLNRLYTKEINPEPLDPIDGMPRSVFSIQNQNDNIEDSNKTELSFAKSEFGSPELKRYLWDKPNHANDLCIEEVNNSMDKNEVDVVSDEFEPEFTPTIINLDHHSALCVESQINQDEKCDDAISVKPIVEMAAQIRDTNTSVEEEKSISVNVSFEIEYSQKAKEPEKIQMLLKDCKFIRKDLLDNVAKITEEISKGLEENVSDESLQLDWVNNSSNSQEVDGDEIAYFKVTGNDCNNCPVGTDEQQKPVHPVLPDVVLNIFDTKEGTIQSVPMDLCSNETIKKIPVRIKMEDTETTLDERVCFIGADKVIEQWEKSPEVRVSEWEYPLENINDSNEYGQLKNDELYGYEEVPSLRTLCYMALNVSRSSSEESFPVLVTSFRDTDVSFVDNDSKSEADLSLVSLSDLSGGAPSPRVHYIVRGNKTLQLVKGNLSRSDDEYINFMTLKNRALFGFNLGLGNINRESNSLIWPWGSPINRGKRRYSDGDINEYSKLNKTELFDENTPMQIIDSVDNLNCNNNNNNCDSLIEDRDDTLFMESTLSGSSRHEVDYGKFYNTSYLQKPSGAQLRGPSINPKGEPKSPHYHRPENFSYSQVRKDFIKPMKKGMMSALGESMTVQKKKLEDYMEEPMRNKEVINLARFPDNVKHEEDRQAAIEREDFPAPPATAAAYPELLYKHYKPPRRSKGSDVDSPDGNLSMEVDEEEAPVDPKLLKDIDHLTKLEQKSGAAKVFLEHLKRKSKEPPPPIDPVSSSRTPAADREPMYKTRYESHVFASPSRDLDYRARMYSFDDQMIGRKYRSALQSVANFPVDRRSYELPKTRSNKYTVMKPGYTLRQPRTAHMPSTFASARANGYFSDIEQCVTRDSDFEELDRRYEELERRQRNINRRPHVLDRRSQELDRRSQELDHKSQEPENRSQDRRSQELDLKSHDPERRSQKSHSMYTSQSSIEEYDPVTGLRRGIKLRGSSVSSDLVKTKSPYQTKLASFLKFEEPPQIYSYEELKLTNLHLPPGVDRNWLEVHLTKEEFESIFHMSREAFYRLAEWKRNDMKQRVLLF